MVMLAINLISSTHSTEITGRESLDTNLPEKHAERKKSCPRVEAANKFSRYDQKVMRSILIYLVYPCLKLPFFSACF